jgi:hypothetical protein
MKKIRIGVLGLYRGSSMIDFCRKILRCGFRQESVSQMNR